MAQREQTSLPRMIPISSGKGGVGKSTVTANIAVAMADAGLSVGIVDAGVIANFFARSELVTPHA